MKSFANDAIAIVKINLNQKVKVKITAAGKAHSIQRHKEIFGSGKGAPKFQPQEEDKDGYSVWQLWDLMGHFGEAMKYPTVNPPIDPEIELID